MLKPITSTITDLLDHQSTDALVAQIDRALAALKRRGVRVPEAAIETFRDELDEAIIETDARRNPVAFRRRAQRYGIAA